MKLPYMPLYIADYLQDTGHLTTAEHGAYLLLIMHYWTTGGLPQNENKLARIARMSGKEWSKHRSTIADLFDDDQWRHYRIDAELSIASEKSEARAKAGRMGGLAKAKGMAKAKHCSSNATANTKHPSHIISEEEGSKTPALRAGRRKPKIPLPENWLPASEETSDNEELQRFTDHARANDRRCADWDAAWRNWKRSPFQKVGRPAYKDKRQEELEDAKRSLDESIARHRDAREGGNPDEASHGVLPFTVRSRP